MISLYTDGSCDNSHTKTGGWGYVLLHRLDVLTNSGRTPLTTSNRMEMTAVIQGLRHINLAGFTDTRVSIFSDSALIIDSMNKGWKREANKDLWQEIDTEIAQLNTKGVLLSWQWIKAHNGNEWNELADCLANHLVSHTPNQLF